MIIIALVHITNNSNLTVTLFQSIRNLIKKCENRRKYVSSTVNNILSFTWKSYNIVSYNIIRLVQLCFIYRICFEWNNCPICSQFTSLYELCSFVKLFYTFLIDFAWHSCCHRYFEIWTSALFSKAKIDRWFWAFATWKRVLILISLFALYKIV